ncbi:XdhC family protein [Clostridia bacterium]|nr:XdhC family protein [Clostridia bacterium]
MYESIYAQLVESQKNGINAALVTKLMQEPNGSKQILSKRLFIDGEQSSLPCEEQGLVTQTLKQGRALWNTKLDGTSIWIEPYVQKPRLIILGAGHISKPLVAIASMVSFDCVVADDRPSFANRNRFPDAKEILCDSFENMLHSLQIGPADLVISITRGHRHDELCLRKALPQNPAFLGMIGSKRRVKLMKEILLADGFSKDALDKLHAPIGLDIAAATPEEIAVAIVAQLIEERRKKLLSSSWADLDKDMLTSLAEDTSQRKALVSIISSKGSVPRKVGAKMLVLEDSRILGTIGGGCAEAAIIQKARRFQDPGTYFIERIDMTNEVAEEEGMVCGGIMDVLLEFI